jgi:DNA primase
MPALLDAGLVVRREKGEGAYDRFRDRGLVPLRLPSGRVVGFGGRTMGDETPKYLNSPETAVYRKGKFLFGLDRARAAFKSTGEAVLVEGYFDVLALAQAGVTEAICSSGTALTLDQCRLLKRYVPRVLLVFDGDAAGQTAAEKALVPATQAGLATRVVVLPEGEDPDTLVRRGGRTEWDRVVERAQSPVGFLAARHQGDREEALRACARLGAAAEDPITARLLVEEAARLLAFDEGTLGREVERMKAGGKPRFEKPAPPKPAPVRAAPRRATDLADEARTRALESGFLELLVAHPELLGEAQGRFDPAWLRDPVCAALAFALFGPPARDPGAVLADPELAPEVRALLSALLAVATPKRAPKEALAEGIDRFTRRVLEEEHRALRDEAAQAKDEATRARIFESLQRNAAAVRALAPAARRKETA